MYVAELGDTIIKIGICGYGIKQYRLFLCTKTFLPGTGDYEDDPPIYDDQKIDCYCIWIEDMINAGNICAEAGYYEHLSDAIHAAESSAGFERWIN